MLPVTHTWMSEHISYGMCYMCGMWYQVPDIFTRMCLHIVMQHHTSHTHALCMFNCIYMYPTSCMSDHAASIMKHALHTIHRMPQIVYHTSQSAQHTSWSIQHVRCNMYIRSYIVDHSPCIIDGTMRILYGTLHIVHHVSYTMPIPGSIENVAQISRMCHARVATYHA